MIAALKKLIQPGWGNPVGFVVSDGKVQWCNGKQYTWDGNNPNRTESVWLSGHHGLLCSWVYNEDARPATIDEAKAHLKRVREYLEGQRRFTTAKYKERMQEIDSMEYTYEQRLKDFKKVIGAASDVRADAK